MGMFDYLRCRLSLPFPEELDPVLVATLQNEAFQTKDTPNQYLDNYEIRVDGSLWVEQYDVEDHSDPNAKGIARICGMMTRVNERWVPVTGFTDTVRFYTSLGKQYSGWIEFVAQFTDGRVTLLRLEEYRPIDPVQEAERAEQMRQLWEKMKEGKDEGETT